MERPHVLQDLRALNLAALDFVDYVVVYDSKKPLDLIATLQPDFYAKGFEYSAVARPERTIEEASIVESYGGELIFTPGDVVYSSSVLLNDQPPDLSRERLVSVMSRFDVTFDDLRAVLGQITGELFVHVVGDTIVDRIVRGSVIGGPVKTPTISVLRQDHSDFVGGAGVVAKHLQAAGATVKFSTVLGGDQLMSFVVDDLRNCGISEVDYLVDESRSTTLKEAVVVDSYRLLKVDTVDSRSISDPLRDALVESIVSTRQDAVVVYSDFRHGIFNSRTLPDLLSASIGARFRVADSQVASRWGNVLDFPGMDLITPNEREARFCLGDQDLGVRPLASRLYDAAGCGVLILKLGNRGVLVVTGLDHEDLGSYFSVDSFARRVVDPVGAGDALLAYATLGLRVDPHRPVIAAILGIMAAAVECGSDGNVPVGAEYVRDMLDGIEKEVS
jgi:bifunctional ADP-heptose synthase (sugar kinase/adenylyltransferase)